MKTSKRIISIASAIIVIASIVTLCFGLNDYVAKSADLDYWVGDYQQYKDSQRLKLLQERVWQLQQHYMKNPPTPQSVQEEILFLQMEIEELKIKLNKKGG